MTLSESGDENLHELTLQSFTGSAGHDYR